MSRNCDSYREQAMIDGMDSPAAAHWRLHSKNCNACRSEIHALESLCQQAGEKRQHISHKDYTRLVETVRQLYQPKTKPHWGMICWNFTWKTASIAAMLVLIFKVAAPFGPVVKSRISGMPAPLSASVQSQIFADTFTAGADQGHFLASPAPLPISTLSNADLSELFNTLPGSEIEKDLQKLRSSVAGQIDALSNLLDRELNGEL
ncbi:MAG: hypothetical protein PHY82_01415 [Lentisphaeria bacterium]|nr:hypothetical protein [Lentisphaeria bacterium]